jgi:hypothetical protein
VRYCERATPPDSSFAPASLARSRRYCITGGAFLPVHFLLCVVGWCLNQCLKMLTKFTLIIHCITGNSFMESAKLTFNVMTRHFVNAFITDSVSATVLALGSFVFAMTITAVGWLWIDEA